MAKAKKKTLEARIREKVQTKLKEEIEVIFLELYTADLFGEESIPLGLYRKGSKKELGSTDVIEIFKDALFQRDKEEAVQVAFDKFIESI